VFDALDRPARIEFVEMPPGIRDAYQYATKGAIDRLRRTGYDRPVTPLRDAVREYVCEYLVPDRRLGDEPGIPAQDRGPERPAATDVQTDVRADVQAGCIDGTYRRDV
jgi:hypothetical protein